MPAVQQGPKAVKIKKVIASDFGCLSGSYSLGDDRANVVVEENERGKSTFVAAILAGLYGFPRTGEERKLKESYRPWKGGSYGIQLEVEDGQGRPLLIERDFSDRAGGEERVKVTDASTNKDVTRHFRAGKRDFAIGERLLGISREIFVKTCLVRQLDIEKVGDKSDDLVSKVQRIFDTSAGKGTAAGAILVLQEAMRNFAGSQLKKTGLVENEIGRLKEAIGRREAHMEQLAQERKKAAPSMIRLRDLRRRLEMLEARRHQLEYLTRGAEIAETESAQKEDAKNRSEVRKLIERKESLKQFSDFPKEKASEFARVAGRLDELRKQKRQKEVPLGEIKKELEDKKSKLREFHDFEGLSDDFKTRLHDLGTELKRVLEEAGKARQELNQFQQSLQREGYDLSEVDGLFRKFSALTVEDKDLLRDSESRIPQTGEEVATLKAAEKACHEELRAMRMPAKVLLPVGAVLCLVGIAGVALWSVAAVSAAAAGAAAIGVALLLLRFKAHRVDQLKKEEQAAREQRQSLQEQREELAKKLEEMAQKGEFETAAQLSEAFKRAGRLEDRKLRLDSLRESADGAKEKTASCRTSACEELKKVGLHVSPGEIDVPLLQRAEKTVAEYVGLVASVKAMEERRVKLEEDVRELDREKEGLEESYRSILTAANLPQGLSPEEALPGVEQARANSEEFHRLDTRDIPERQRRLLPAEKVRRMTQRLELLRQKLEKMVTEKPELESLHLTKARPQYEEEARRVATELVRKTEEREKIAREVQNVEERYREEYPRLANEVSELKETLDRTERFRKSVLLAVQTLERISTQSHALWASALNPRANEILRHLNPRCRELKFLPDLSFTIIPEEGFGPLGKEQIQSQQSVGARHQIYLAVRLALSDYLSSAPSAVEMPGRSVTAERAEKAAVPVILDDPFATSDDERFLSGMKFLCREFRKNHQVIILTCHRRRHSDLIREKAPDLINEMRLVSITPPAQEPDRRPA